MVSVGTKYVYVRVAGQVQPAKLTSMNVVWELA